MSVILTMNRARLAGAALAFLAALPTAGQAAAKDDVHWRPAETRVFIASLCWYQGEAKPDFALDERLDGKMADLFQEKGVPKQQIKVLLDQKATVQNVKNEFAQFMKESKPGELLVAYLSGHGYCGGLALFDKGLKWDWFFDAMEKDFKGDRAFLMSDCCYSGGVVETANKRKSKIAYACLSSTFSQQSAWSGWRFAQCLMRGFEGNPVVDRNGDGRIELEELADYTAHYMAFAAEGKPQFTTTGGFSPKLQLAKVKGKKRDNVGDLVEALYSDNKWYPAEIIGVRPKGYRIHFVEDTKTTNDRNVTRDKIRPFTYLKFKVGDPIVVKSGDVWKPAKVLETFDSLCLCRIKGAGPDNDEWFGPDRIRKPR